MENKNWINVHERLPNPFNPCWIFWKGKKVVIGWRTYEVEEAINCPPDEGWWSVEHEKCKWATHWMPIDKPKSPIG